MTGPEDLLSTQGAFIAPLDVAVINDVLPAAPFPNRGGRSSEVIVPKYIYIRDGKGRYLSVVSASPLPSLNSSLTFRSGPPDLNCTFETIRSQPSRFKLLSNNGNQISRQRSSDGTSSYVADTVDPQYFITFLFIQAKGDKVYLQDNNVPSRFMSNQLGLFGSPLGRDFINEDSEMQISIGAVKNDIIDVHYDLKGANVRAAPPLIALSTSVRNDSDGDINQNLTYSYEKWSAGTWNNSAGIEIGAKSSFSASVPFVGSADFEISLTASYSHEWGGEQGVRQTVTSSTTVTVPPKKKARATVVVRNAQIDVGFTYTQRVLWANGKSEDNKLSGIYNNVDSWHVDVELDDWQSVW